MRVSRHVPRKYRGRFAPSPTGPLHYGSLVTAVASYLQARRHSQGEWYIRIEDIDPNRQPKGATKSILQSLSDYGFKSNKKPIFQSHHYALYKRLAKRLIKQKRAYYCECSRKDILSDSQIGSMGPIYTGKCANKHLAESYNNLRIRVNQDTVAFKDLHYGQIFCDLFCESGDYVIFRAEDLPSYIFAVSIDDIYEGYTQIVRGVDLLDITPRQIHLSKFFSNSVPDFFHIPIITDDSGNKLSKQTHAPELKKRHVRANLYFALQDLGQNPPRQLLLRSVSSIWKWAIKHWQPTAIPKQKLIKYDH